MGSVVGMSVLTLKFHMVSSRWWHTPAGTGVSLEEGTTSTKDVSLRQGGSMDELS